MAQVVADRVRDTTTTTGTGAVTVSGTAPATYLTFSARCTVNDTLAYFIAHQSADEWECGVGTYSASNQLTRTTVLSSSNSDAVVSFSAGTKDVVLTQIANRSYQQTGFTGLSHTVTTSVPALDLSQTWNNAGTVFTALKMNVTNTASAAGSHLIDLQEGGTTTFAIDAGTNPFLSFGQSVQKFQIQLFSYNTSFHVAGTQVASFSTVPGFTIGTNGGTPTIYFSDRTVLISDTNNVLEQRLSTNAQTFRVYNTYTDASNYERAVIDWTTTSNVLIIGAQAGGTGTLRMSAHVAFQKAGAAVAGDLPSGTFAVVRDTSGSTTKLVYNNAGTLMTVALT